MAYQKPKLQLHLRSGKIDRLERWWEWVCKIKPGAVSKCSCFYKSRQILWIALRGLRVRGWFSLVRRVEKAILGYTTFILCPTFYKTLKKNVAIQFYFKSLNRSFIFVFISLIHHHIWGTAIINSKTIKIADNYFFLLLLYNFEI